MTPIDQLYDRPYWVVTDAGAVNRPFVMERRVPPTYAMTRAFLSFTRGLR